MNVWFRNSITGRYLLTEAPEGHGFEYGMMGTITDEHLILPIISYEEGRRCLTYNIAGLESLESKYSRRWFAPEDITGFMLQLNRILEKLQNHLLTEQNLLLGRDRIFLEPQSGQLRFLVHPAADTGFFGELRRLLEFMVIRADRENADAIRMAADLLEKSEDPDFCFGELPLLLFKYCGSEGKQEEDPELPSDIQPADNEEFETAVPPPEAPVRQAFRRREGIPLQPEIKNMLIRLAASQGIMLAGLLSVLLLRGRLAVRHALPIYLILCTGISLYFLLDMAIERRRRLRPRRSKKRYTGSR